MSNNTGTPRTWDEYFTDVEAELTHQPEPGPPQNKYAPKPNEKHANSPTRSASLAKQAPPAPGTSPRQPVMKRPARTSQPSSPSTDAPVDSHHRSSARPDSSTHSNDKDPS